MFKENLTNKKTSKQCFWIREQSLLMPGGGAEDIWRGHENFFNY
jgi:hypothetical protein